MSTRRIKISVVAPLTLLFALLALLQYLYFPSKQHALLSESLRAKAVAVSELVAHDISSGLDFEDKTLVDEVFAGAANEADLRYVAAVLDNGSLFSQHVHESFGRFDATAFPNFLAMLESRGVAPHPPRPVPFRCEI